MSKLGVAEKFIIEGKLISKESPVYFIADIGANHDGDLTRAKELIYMAAEAGADAAKFQHFKANTIVSKRGFSQMGGQHSHQSKWKKTVYEVYEDASLNEDWTPILKKTCNEAGITFFTSPYSPELVAHVNPYVAAYKIGSGDITWPAVIELIAKQDKPVFLATGASSLEDVVRAVDLILQHNPALCLMQCNTNYTGSIENFKYVQLNVLKTFQKMYPDMLLGLSDHTPGHAAVLGAVALGARVVEKHFTDSNERQGPDHAFALNPITWREMVDRTAELCFALGGELKKIEDNELETVVLQRRALRVIRDMQAGEELVARDIYPTRPCPKEAIPPYDLEKVLGRKLKNDLKEGMHIQWNDLV